VTPRRISIVTDELHGIRPAGGIATGTTFLALGLARMGHEVEMLHVSAPATTLIDPQWKRVYERAGISIRFVRPSEEKVEPRYFARLPETARALQGDRPDVVIAQDTAGPAYVALRLRELGIEHQQTCFVVFCHGTRGWIKDMARNVRVFPYLLGVTMLERASIELADVVVSPSAYLLEWMKGQGWRLPADSVVIPYLTESIAKGLPSQPPSLYANGSVERVVFFGRLDERKGVRPFVAGVNALEPALLRQIELEFVGAEIPMSREGVEGLLSNTARQALRGVSFATDLGRREALALLSRPGTLAVMPSLEDNSPNTVYECLEHSIPFLASHRGGTAELIAPEDRQRVLFEPTAEGVEAALRSSLRSNDALRPARAAFDPADSLSAWEEVIAAATPRPRKSPVAGPEVDVDVVVVARGSEDERARCLSALGRQSYPRVNVITVESRDHSSLAGDAPFVVFLEARDEPAEDFVAVLVRAQAAAGADVVTCGLHLRSPPRQHLFLGDPGGLGVLSNSYGTPALIRRSLLDDGASGWPVEGGGDWPLLARLHLGGARIVSVPMPLLTRSRPPGSIEQNPSDALLVLGHHEQALPAALRPLALLAAGLAASAHGPAPSGGRAVRTFAGRIRRRLRR
jgi:glycosyltransferase involved in cell wall biosynthesis